VLATLSTPKDYINELDIVEAMAALKTVNVCRALSFCKVILESDSV
jgi:hypothetical protein